MTLPQHLEPFTMEDNTTVLVALKHGKLPYTDETGKWITVEVLNIWTPEKKAIIILKL